jgi:CHAT domain-containing protein
MCIPSTYSQGKSLSLSWMIVFTMILLLSASGNASPEYYPQKRVVQAKQSARPKKLVVGQPLIQRIRGGETQLHPITLKLGEYLNVSIKWQVGDIVSSLIDPSGTALVTTESKMRIETDKTESFYWVAETPGDYKIQVRLLERSKIYTRYTVTIDELHVAGPENLGRMKAYKLFMETSGLAEGSAESISKKVDKYRETLPLWRIAKDVDSELVTLNTIGVLYHKQRNYKDAEDTLAQALALARSSKSRAHEGSILHNLAAVYFYTRRIEKSLDTLKDALLIRREVKDHKGEADTLGLLSSYHAAVGNRQQALDYALQELPLQKGAIGEDLAKTLNMIGNMYSHLGDNQMALNYLDQSLSICREIGNTEGEAALLTNIGNIYSQLGDKKKALNFLEDALPLIRKGGDRSIEADILHSIGLIYSSRGETQKALELYNQALGVWEKAHNIRGQAYTHNVIGSLYLKQKDIPKSIEHFDKVLSILAQAQDRNLEPYALERKGLAYVRSGKLQEALDLFTKAYAISQETGDRLGAAHALMGIALIERERGHLQEARIKTAEAIANIELIRLKLARHDLRASFVAEVSPYYEDEIDLLMQMHKTNPSAGYDAEALQLNEKFRARSLLDRISEARAKIREGVDPGLLKREQDLRGQLTNASDTLQRLARDKNNEGQVARLKKDVDKLIAAIEGVHAEIRQKSPRYANLTQPKSLSVPEIKQLLDDNTILLEYALGKERSFLWIVSKTGMASFELPKREIIEAQARQLYEALTVRAKRRSKETAVERRRRLIREAEADKNYRLLSNDLAHTLLSPIASLLGEKRLLIVRDGALQYVPFSALPISGSDTGSGPLPMMIKHEIVSLPSASTLAVIRNETMGRPQAPKSIAVLADPVFDVSDNRVKQRILAEGKGDRKAGGINDKQALELTVSLRDSGAEGESITLPRLPFSYSEGVAITKPELLPKRDFLLATGFNATRTLAMNPELSKFRIIHFSTHGVLDSVNPELSGVVLSLVDQQGKPLKGFLQLHDIYNLKLPAQLVVLSACQTGLGKETRAEGLVGLTRGFMYAGAARVVASLWSVNDFATAEFMESFYKAMLGEKKLSPAAALRAAQEYMFKETDWMFPFYWAAFEMQGEWR